MWVRLRIVPALLIVTLIVVGGCSMRTAEAGPQSVQLNLDELALAAVATSKAEKDVTYAIVGDAILKMDIYYPVSISGLAPAIVFVHGGGFVSGNRSYDARFFVERGYLVASIDYRLAPRYRWPAQIEDTKCAIRYLRANANKYQLDPNRIGAMGPSAGGHLVAMLGITNSSAGFDNSGGYLDQSSRVQAVVDMYGTTDLVAMRASRSDMPNLFNQWFGTPNPSEEALRKASPITYVTADSAPFLIVHGEQDDEVPPSQSQAFYERLKTAGATATLVMVKNAKHGLVPVADPVSPSRQEITRMIGDFFDKYVKGLPASTTTATTARSSQLPTITTTSTALTTSITSSVATNPLESYGVIIGVAVVAAVLVPLLVRRNRKSKSHSS